MSPFAESHNCASSMKCVFGMLLHLLLIPSTFASTHHTLILPWMYGGGNRNTRFAPIVYDALSSNSKQLEREIFAKTPPLKQISQTYNTQTITVVVIVEATTTAATATTAMESLSRQEMMHEMKMNALSSFSQSPLMYAICNPKPQYGIYAFRPFLLPFVPIPINFIRIMCRGLLSS